MTAKNPPVSEEYLSSADEVALDGVRYALLRHNGCLWRVGSLAPAWQAEIAGLPINPSPEDLQNLASRGIYLARQHAPEKLAVMCAGLGAAWPGMGRTLYDNFPAARNAMDELASLANWDMLGLLDENDAESVNSSKKQILYLFLLEYAQWNQLQSLGLQPDMICGHSLGELVALCLAGVYNLEAALLLFESRARHMEHLEALPNSQGGMLAISADFDTIADILKKWPQLSVSNSNTPRQYILGGPREILLDVRKTFRKKRVPAFMLNINLAFHNPAMRVLRDLSTRRLDALEMHPPKIPLLSCVTAAPYPREQKEICRYIADLDENTVDWISTVRALRDQYHIRHFVELGPTETLCGLVTENDSGAQCMGACRKGHETLAMRHLCASLFASGHLHMEAIKAQKEERHPLLHQLDATIENIQTNVDPLPQPAIINEHDEKIILRILAEAAHVSEARISRDMDLRYDLSLRSSNFPWLVQEAEERLGRPVPLDNIFQISTVGDLINFLCGNTPASINQANHTHRVTSHRQAFLTAPLNFFTFCGDTGKIAPCYIDLDHKGTFSQPGGLVILLVGDCPMLPQIWQGLAIFNHSLAIPRHLLGQCQCLEKSGNRLIPLDCPPNQRPEEFLTALENLVQTHGQPAGMLFMPPALQIGENAKKDAWDEPANFPMADLLSTAISFFRKAGIKPWLTAIRRHVPDPSHLPASNEFFQEQTLKFQKEIRKICQPAFPDCHTIAWLDGRLAPNLQNPGESGDMLAMDLLYNTAAQSVWQTGNPPDINHSYGYYCPSSPDYHFIYPQQPPEAETLANVFQGLCQFSTYATPSLESHGPGLVQPQPAVEVSLDKGPTPWLPMGHAAGAMLECVQLMMPWLEPASLQDFRIFRFIHMPKAITRECALSARKRPWLLQDGSMTRILNVEMSVREISANGRHSDKYLPMASCLCAMSHKLPPLVPLWAESSIPGFAQWKTDITEEFYRVCGLDSHWRIVQSCMPHRLHQNSKNPSSALFFRLAASPCSIAKNSIFSYNISLFSKIMDGIFQAALLSLAFLHNPAPGSDDICSSLQEWIFSSMGYIRFNLPDLKNHSEFVLEIRAKWFTEKVCRFDAQLYAPDDKLVLTLTHMEFNRGVENQNISATS